jgi:uncharacterized protein YcfJ
MVQKLLVAIFVGLLIGSSNVNAQESPSTEQVLGAIAGGALGSTIGDGDGRKAATVIGAIIGWRMGERILSNEEHKNFMTLNEHDFRRYCRHEVPGRYSHDRRLAERWVLGCVHRLERQQKELEREAYFDGLNDK